MHIMEFHAWFEGYTENIKDTPSTKQWARIKEQAKRIDGAWTAPQTIIHEYRRYPWFNNPVYHPYWSTAGYWSAQSQTVTTYSNANNAEESGSPVPINTTTTFYNLGLAEGTTEGAATGEAA